VSYTREAEKHVHRVPHYRLRGAKRIQVCIVNYPGLAEDLAAFAKIWDKAMALLAARNLTKLADGVDVVFTSRRGYYARFWRGNTLCIALKDLIGQRDRAPGIIVHELGHRVWFHIATQKTRARWAADHHHRTKIDRLGGSFVSSYAKKSALEDHAEAFRARVEGQLKGHALTRYERLGPLTRTIQQRLGS